jgi:hypothetical protein
MLKIEIYGTIQDHKLTLSNRKKLQEDLNQCNDCEVIVVIKKRGKRSNQQNRFLWGIIYAECKLAFLNLGHRLEIDDIHQYFKQKFLSRPLANHDGTVIAEISGSTTELNKEEFSNYVENIRQFASMNLGIDIPDADSSLAMNF